MKTHSTKSDTQPTDAQPGPSVSLTKTEKPLSLRTSARISRASTSHQKRLKRPISASPKLVQELPRQYLSKSLEKTFLRMKIKAIARHAYLEAETITGLAHQIRAIRMQRGWTQDDLAARMKTTQNVVSRLEDPSYGRYTLKTLLDLAKTFDTGMQVRFVSFITMLQQTFKPDAKAREVLSFEDEAPCVDFYRLTPQPSLSRYIEMSPPEIGSSTPYFQVRIPRVASVQPVSVKL